MAPSDIPGSTSSSSGEFEPFLKRATGNYTVAAADGKYQVIFIDADGITITLPNAATCAGTIVHITGGANGYPCKIALTGDDYTSPTFGLTDLDVSGSTGGSYTFIAETSGAGDSWTLLSWMPAPLVSRNEPSLAGNFSVDGDMSIGGTLTVTGSSIVPYNIQSVSTSGNLMTGVTLVTVGASSLTQTLPTAVGRKGQSFIVKRKGGGGSTLTVNTTSSQTIDGATSKSVASDNEVLHVVSDNSNWQVL